MSALAKKNWHSLFIKIFQVSADEGMGKWSNLVEFWSQKLFKIRAHVISARKAKHLDVTTMFTYSHANTPLGQWERAYYISYFIIYIGGKIKWHINRAGHGEEGVHSFARFWRTQDRLCMIFFQHDTSRLLLGYVSHLGLLLCAWYSFAKSWPLVYQWTDAHTQKISSRNSGVSDFKVLTRFKQSLLLSSH